MEFVQTLDIGGQYWVVRLADDYSYSVVSSPDVKLLWILYREPHMPESLFNEIYEDLKKDGFPVQKLRKTEQWFLIPFYGLINLNKDHRLLI